MKVEENKATDVSDAKSQELINTIINIVREHLHPKRIILFGSRAKGKEKEYSDFDIAVEGVEMDIRKERLLKEALDEKMGIYTVEVIDLDKVDEGFRAIVMKTGRVIYEGSEDSSIQGFE
jgi:predicted nucleotidyltransferase